MNIAETLKNLRLEHGLTQTELGKRIKIGQATIACYENGQREPHILSLMAYADYFECSIDYLLGRSDDFGNIKMFDDSQTNKVFLDDDEIILIRKYRRLDGKSKQKLHGYLDGLSDK